MNYTLTLLIFSKKLCILDMPDEKLGEMEKFYSSKRDENFRIGATAMEERLMSFQRQLEERYRTDLKLEVRHWHNQFISSEHNQFRVNVMDYH